jgi:ABC-type Na+ transport system ATPase subunit NatA
VSTRPIFGVSAVDNGVEASVENRFMLWKTAAAAVRLDPPQEGLGEEWLSRSGSNYISTDDHMRASRPHLEGRLPLRSVGERRMSAPAAEPAPTQAAIPEEPVLTLTDLARRFGRREVVRSLDLRLGSGEKVALWGPNGSGKSTVLRCIVGTLLPSAGEVRVCGHEAGSFPARSIVGASLSQERSFDMRLTGHANLLFFARMRFQDEREAARHVAEIEEELELATIASERINRASSGMVQQIALARALLGNPALVLLDEPTRSLDVDARRRLWDALVRRTKTSLVIATHLEEDLRRCDGRVDFPT